MPENSYDTPTRKSPLPSPAGESEFPNIQAGRYKFICVIGSGGAGTVYKAHDTSLDKIVAIKKLHSASQDQAIRFQREARLAGSLKHENVMSAIDFGISDRNEPYLVLDYVNGESLATLIKRVGRLPVIDALPILIQIADGLDHAHKNGVIHRDIKPSNVILVETGDDTAEDDQSSEHQSAEERIAKIVDFGLSKSVHDDQSITEAGIGTPKYMSPEHAHAREIDERSDVYSFGCLMFETLTGSVPFKAASAVETIHMHLNAQPPTLQSYGIDCSEGLEKLVATCLQKEPGSRYQSFARIADLLVHEFEQLHQSLASNESDSEELERGDASERDHESPASTPLSRKFMNVAAISAIVVLSGLILMAIPILLAPNESDQKTANESIRDKRKKDPKPDETSRYAIAVGDSKARILGSELSGNGDGRATLFCVDGVTDNDIEFYFKNNPKKKVTSFDLSDSAVTSHGFDLLAKYTKLDSLEYCDKPLNAETISNVIRLQHLAGLKVGNTTDIAPESLVNLSKLHDLRVLGVVRTPLNESALKAISQIKSVRALELTGCTGLDSNALKHLLRLPELDYVILDGTDVTDQALAVLIKHPRLTNFSLKWTGVSDAFVDQLQNMPTLLALDVRHAKNVTPQAIGRLLLSCKKKGRKIPVVQLVEEKPAILPDDTPITPKHF